MKVIIGKIVKSSSHINYICQIYGPREIETPPDVAEYAFGHFVRVAVPSKLSDLSRHRQGRDQSVNEESSCYAVGVIYDTQLLNPAFGSLGPRLSNETQVELFSPDYLTEQAVLVHLVMLGMVQQQRSARGSSKNYIVHGIPSFPLELNSSVETMTDEEVHGFHFFHDQGNAEDRLEYLHMGYLPHMIVFATIADDGEFRPRFANEAELDDWEAGPTLYNYANRLGESGWELLASNPMIFTQSKWQPLRESQSISSELRAITMVFKRPKKDNDDGSC